MGDFQGVYIFKRRYTVICLKYFSEIFRRYAAHIRKLRYIYKPLSILAVYAFNRRFNYCILIVRKIFRIVLFYRDVPVDAFPYELEIIQEGEYYYRIAGPENALCDKLYTMSPVANADEIFILLTEDLRIEESELAKLDRKKIVMLSEHYQKDFPVRQTV